MNYPGHQLWNAIFYFKGKRFAYLWVDKKIDQPYIGYVNGDKMSDPSLDQGDRKKMKILLLDKRKDLPVVKIRILIKMAINLLKDV